MVTKLTKKNETTKSFSIKNGLPPAHVGRKTKKSFPAVQLFTRAVRLIAKTSINRRKS